MLVERKNRHEEKLSETGIRPQTPEEKFKRLKGHRQMPRLIEALERETKIHSVDFKHEAA